MPLPSEILETLPEDLRSNETLSRYNSLEELAKGFIETKSMVGNSIRVPSEDAGAEARTEFINKLINKAPELMIKPDFTNPEQSEEFFTTLGVPDDFSKYQNPEGVELPQETEAELRQVLHQARLTPAQYAKVVDQLSAMNKQAMENYSSSKQAEMTELAGKWGNALNQRMEAAKKVNAEFFGDRPFENLSAREIEGLFAIHKSVTSESMQAANQPASQTLILSPAEAEEQAQEILRNPVLWSPDTPQTEKQRLMDKVVKLRLQAGYGAELPRAGQ